METHMSFWKTVLAVFVGILLYNVADNITVYFSAMHISQ
jgi:hypothetical protein